MATDGIRIGPVGERVADNLRELRGHARLSVRALSKRLEILGQPIAPSAITKIEKGKRRVDVDELVALALALNVTPNRLLLAGRADEEPIELSPSVAEPAVGAWRWAGGELPFRDLGFGFSRWDQETSRPDDPPMTVEELERLGGQDGVAQLVEGMRRAVADGVRLGALIQYLGVQWAMDQVTAEMRPTRDTGTRKGKK
jgi:transcriptional regulator with XRE-family HTH domain